MSAGLADLLLGQAIVKRSPDVNSKFRAPVQRSEHGDIHQRALSKFEILTSITREAYFGNVLLPGLGEDIVFLKLGALLTMFGPTEFNIKNI